MNYGGRQEIVKAVEHYVAKCVGAGVVPDFETVREDFPKCLMTHDMPDPDILIRTSGEQRLSNFLLWQCAYAELIFDDVYWPDFSKVHMEKAIDDFKNRDRRFGGLSDSDQKQSGA